MLFRTLGQGGLKVSAIGLGGRRLSDNHTETQNDDDRARALVDAAIAGGLTLIDSADVYAEGENERMFGRILDGGRREKIVLCTKFGIVVNADGSRGVNGRPEYALSACEASLRRLRTDVIDLYYLHRVDPDVPVEDTVGAMMRLREQGKIRHIGLSAAGAGDIRRAAAVHPITALQSDYSLWERGIEADVLPACRALSIGVVAYYPLGMGFLAGAIRAVEALGPQDSRRKRPQFQGETMARNWDQLLRLKTIADERGCKLGQLALAWILSQGPGFAAIPGTSQVAHLADNLAAADISLTPDDLARIDAIYPPGGATAGAAEGRA